MIFTGNHLMANTNNLRKETKMRSVNDHNMVLTKQDIVACHKLPCQSLLSTDMALRTIRHTHEFAEHVSQDELNNNITLDGYI